MCSDSSEGPSLELSLHLPKIYQLFKLRTANRIIKQPQNAAFCTQILMIFWRKTLDSEQEQICPPTLQLLLGLLPEKAVHTHTYNTATIYHK